ncbi:MAG: PorT family protein [Tannerella sp.]|jgi:hypothetical protein|nr:PorT family protein [Tannerella sp.]
MRKILLSLICITLAGVVSSYAQSKVRFLMKGGLNLSNITHLDGEGKSGLNVGLGMDWQISKKIGIETGLYYSEYGSEYEVEINPGESQKPIKQNYSFSAYHLQIPVLAKYYVYKGFHVFAGPQAGYKLKHKNSGDYFYNMRRKDFYFSGIAGAGYQFGFGLSLSANYMLGLTELDPSYETFAIVGKNGETTTISFRYDSRHIKLRAFQLNIGWRF